MHDGNLIPFSHLSQKRHFSVLKNCQPVCVFPKTQLFKNSRSNKRSFCVICKSSFCYFVNFWRAVFSEKRKKYRKRETHCFYDESAKNFALFRRQKWKVLARTIVEANAISRFRYFVRSRKVFKCKSRPYVRLSIKNFSKTFWKFWESFESANAHRDVICD